MPTDTTNLPKKFLGRGWKFPVEIREDNGHVGTVEYEDSIRQAIWIILSTAKGERVMRPDFGCGLQELVFTVNDASTRGMAEFEVTEALRLWEPRIEVLEVETTSAGEQGEQLLIQITYRVRATDNRFNLVYPFYLERGGL